MIQPQEIEDIENCKNNSQCMFKAIKVVQKKESKEKLIVKNDQGEVIWNTEDKWKVISNHFQKTFNCEDPIPIPEITPQKLKTPFTTEEITKAIKSLKTIQVQAVII